MKSIQIRLKRLIELIAQGGTREHHSIEVVRKIILINIISTIGILCLIPLGISALKRGNVTLGGFDLVVGSVLIANQIHMRKTGKYMLSIYLGVGSAAALFFYLFVTGGIDNSGHLWFYTFPLIASFLIGSRKGAIATIILFCVSVLYITVNNGSPEIANYSMGFKIRFAISLLVVFTYAFFFETVREKNQILLSDKNVELQNEISERIRVEEDLKKAKEMAETANQAKSEFLANMSHELRTPLNHILGFTELVVDKNFGDLNATQTEYLDDVLSSSRHLLSLINDILDLSKVEAGKLELQWSEVNLKLLLENSLIMVKEKAMHHGIQLSTDLDSVPEIIKADERKLKQILYNLLSNAVKFTPDGGQVCLKGRIVDRKDGLSIQTKNQKDIKKIEYLDDINQADNAKPEKCIEVSVCDTGIGIKPEFLESIFDPFEQVENSTSREFQGTGLGLSLSKRFVELHNGKMWATSNGKGKGSTFSFILPA